MDQSNKVIPEIGKENKPTAVYIIEERKESPLLTKVRQNFNIFGGISITFGIFLTLLFYEAGFGLNNLLFTALMITLLVTTMNKLSVKLKSETFFYYTGCILLALSSTLTSSGILQFLNTIGIFLLLDISLLHQFYEDKHWDFMKHFLRMLGLPFLSIASLGLPFIDGIAFMKHTKVFKNDKVRNVFLGVIISIPFLLLITALLSSADLMFGKLTSSMFNMVFSDDIFAILFITLFGFLACYCIICASVSGVGLEEKKAYKKADTSIASTFMALLCIVYVIFCFIQVAYLFEGGLLVLPENFTYAEYARRGFFELLTVAIINVSLILICKAGFQASKILRVIVTIMTGCTYIMIVSATYRMILYISAYHLTFLRVFVLLALLIIALVLAGIIITEYKDKFPLFKYCVVVISVCYIIFSLSKPDHYIASYLIENEDQLTHQDIAYLTNDLSLDAAPVVLPLLADQSRYTLDVITEENNYDREYTSYYEAPQDLISNYYQKIDSEFSNQDIRDFNYAKYLANKTADKYPLSIN